MFLRRSKETRDPLAVAMTGVRMGERVLQIGVDDPELLARIAGKTGLSGTAVAMVSDDTAAARVKTGADRVGVIVETSVGALDGLLPFESETFDLAVVHSVSGLLAAAAQPAREHLLGEVRRILRRGGRILVVEAGTLTGLKALMRQPPAAQAPFDAAGGATGALAAAGFAPVRVLGDSEGLRFSEGIRA